MASTRNKNTAGNYCLEQREYKGSSDYTLYPNSQYGAAYNTRFAGNGLNPGQIPWNKLSHNAADTESFLFGINSTNLVFPQENIKPKLINLPQVTYFDRIPLFMPTPLVIERDQRPFPIPQ